MSVLTENPKAPKYQRMIAEMRRQIMDGEFRCGDRLPSLSEAQQQFSASRATVEKVHAMLEHDGLVVREQGRGTFVAARENWRGAAPVSANGQVAQPKAEGLIGFYGVGFLLTGSSSYWVKLLEGIWPHMAQDAKMPSQLLLLDSVAPRNLDRLDGLLINATSGDAHKIQLPPNFPCVSLIAHNHGSEMTSVVADDYAGSREMARHLLKLGHRQIAYLCSARSIDIVPRRLAGYRDALHECGIAPQPNWVRRWKSNAGMNFSGTGRQSMAQWLREDWSTLGCTALMVQNDEAALGAIEALQEAGLRVPEDVSVVGFDGTEIGEYSRPRLTTVEAPLREIGRLAMELLVKQIQNGMQEIEHITLPTTLRVRESSAPPKGGE